MSLLDSKNVLKKRKQKIKVKNQEAVQVNDRIGEDDKRSEEWEDPGKGSFQRDEQRRRQKIMDKERKVQRKRSMKTTGRMKQMQGKIGNESDDSGQEEEDSDIEVLINKSVTHFTLKRIQDDSEEEVYFTADDGEDAGDECDVYHDDDTNDDFHSSDDNDNGSDDNDVSSNNDDKDYQPGDGDDIIDVYIEATQQRRTTGQRKLYDDTNDGSENNSYHCRIYVGMLNDVECWLLFYKIVNLPSSNI